MNQPSKVKLRGGLLAPDPKHMPTLFSLIIVWFTLSITGIVLLPFTIARGTDSYFTDGNNILFWSAICAVSTAHAAMAYMLGYRKGGRIADFIVGGLLMPIGLLWVGGIASKRQDESPRPARGAIKTLDRFTFAFGNLWWGISQLTFMFAVLIRATVYESQVGGSTGNVAAYASYYNASWFGLIFVSFFITLYCATMRKFPFRISQIGWLCTHAGLLILIVGSLVRYWGIYSGSVRVMEGQTITAVQDTAVRELQVHVPTLEFQKNFRIETDTDPVETKEEQLIQFEARKDGVAHEFEIKLDRYHPVAEFFRELEELPLASAPNARPNAVAELKLQGMQGAAQTVRLDESQRPEQDVMGLIKIKLMRAASAHFRDSLAFRYPPGSAQRGALVVKNKAGEVLLQIPVLPGSRGADPALGARTDTKHVLKGGEIEIIVDRYFSQLTASQPGEFFDAAPGRPVAPGITFRINGPRGAEAHSARSDGFWFNSASNLPQDTQYNFVFEYQCRASNPLPASSITVVVGPADEKWIALCNARGQARLEPFKKGAQYRLSGSSPFAVEAVGCLAHGHFREGVRPTDLENGFPVIRATVKKGSKTIQKWIPSGLIRPLPFQFQDSVLTLKYEPRQRELGFAISLLDFREFDYANSTKPKSFESNIILRDEADSIDERVLIDMNHPLSYKGYRFFNSGPLTNKRTGKRGIRFTVSRDPGYPILILGSIITAIGLLTVFGFKPRLRRIETRRNNRKKALMASGANPNQETEPQLSQS